MPGGFLRTRSFWISERGKSYWWCWCFGTINRAYGTYLWERVKLRADGVYPACDTDRIMEDRVVSIYLI